MSLKAKDKQLLKNYNQMCKKIERLVSIDKKKLRIILIRN